MARHARRQNLPLPEFHLGLLAGGLTLHRIRPWRLRSAGRLQRVAGWSLIAAGTMLAGWATGAAGDVDLAHADRLVTSGPYAVSRHPMYIAWTCLYLGVALVVNTRWLIVLSPLLLVLVHRTALAEERQLEKRLGEGYRAYVSRVGRYL